MNCKNCPLNIDSKCFKAEMASRIPLHFRSIFICNNDCAQSCSNNSLCGRDLWVLSFLGQKEKFAMSNAVSTMENLVKKGFSELLCYLFENAPYEKRKEMWLKMTKEHFSKEIQMVNMHRKRCSISPTTRETLIKTTMIHHHPVIRMVMRKKKKKTK